MRSNRMNRPIDPRCGVFHTRILPGIFPACLLTVLLALGCYPSTSAFAQARLPATYSPEQEDPGARAQWERLRLQDENGQIPPNALINAYEQKKAMRFRPEAWGEFLRGSTTMQGIQPEVAGIQPPIWTWNGPGNIGGRVTSIVIHPTNPSIMWLGAPSGGVWKTTNDGSSWRTTTDFIADLNIGTMAMDP